MLGMCETLDSIPHKTQPGGGGGRGAKLDIVVQPIISRLRRMRKEDPKSTAIHGLHNKDCLGSAKAGPARWLSRFNLPGLTCANMPSHTHTQNRNRRRNVIQRNKYKHFNKIMF